MATRPARPAETVRLLAPDAALFWVVVLPELALALVFELVLPLELAPGELGLLVAAAPVTDLVMDEVPLVDSVAELDAADDVELWAAEMASKPWLMVR